MTNIVKYRVQGLWNSEYPLVVNRIIDIAEAYNPHDIHLGQSFDRLAAFRPQLEKIEVYERTSQYSAQLSELDQRRDTLYNVIYGIAKQNQRVPIAEMSDHGHKVMTVLKKHKRDIPTTNYTAETERISDLVADMLAQPDVMRSLEAINLLPLFEEMKAINVEFDNIFMLRNQMQAEKDKVNTAAIRTECDKALTLFYNAIEFCCNEYGEENYIPMLKVINNLNSYYKQQLTARATRRKAKQDVSQEEPIKPLEDTEQPHWTPVPPRDNDKPFEK